MRDFRQEIDIERLLIWTYRRQRADLVIGLGAGLVGAEAIVDGIELQATSTCGCATVAKIAEFGTRLDRTNPPSGRLHDDAETVHKIVLAKLSKPVAGLLVRHAKAADRPDWVPPSEQKIRPVLNGRGQPRRVYEDWDKSRHYGYSLLDYRYSLAMIAGKREIFSMWSQALDIVFDALKGIKLMDYRLTPMRCAREPWLSVSV